MTYRLLPLTNAGGLVVARHKAALIKEPGKLLVTVDGRLAITCAKDDGRHWRLSGRTESRRR